ncbi:MAG: glycoside hydrolase family 65 protein, partial [Clostridia bacterium]|nr:glycoside hydrolase family 65 protein [Clostridia bacterium]
TDTFTRRPLRTYFRDRQIHVSADMVYGLWEYCKVTGDYSLLLEGGIELIYECLCFFYTYSHFKKCKDRYELINVVGPDEYHERVDNNAFTNRMVKYVADTFVTALDKVKSMDKAAYEKFMSKYDTGFVSEFAEKLYVPSPDKKNLIEQFDGYYKLEDVSLDEIRKRVIDPNEYWGCGHGLATTTRILKQADIVMMLNVFRAEYSKAVKKACWEFYEPYTEHGSSLSACAYGIVAASIGKSDWAYKYFLKTAEVDLLGATRQYLGLLYIGGTHPAANGGSWNTAVFGFGGVSYTADALDISPSLPSNWNGLSFNLLYKGVRFDVDISKKGVTVTPESDASGIKITVYGKICKF